MFIIVFLGSINKSLSAIGNVITALVDISRGIIERRQEQAFLEESGGMAGSKDTLHWGFVDPWAYGKGWPWTP
jgi:hypothetical protein